MLENVGLGKINMLAPSESKITPVAGGTEIGNQFTQILNNAITKINDQEKTVNDLTDKFATGELTDIHKLLIASQESTIGLELTVQIRNKVIEAYQEIMRTQV